MIVVVGSLHAEERDGVPAPAGLSADIAVAAARAGARVELVARVGDDPAGDGVLVALARAGVGHVASMRDAAHPTAVVAAPDEPVDADAGIDRGSGEEDAAVGAAIAPRLDARDVGLALRYLPDITVVVLVHPDGDAVIAEAAGGAAYASAALVVLVEPGSDVGAVAADALVLEVDADARAVGAAVGRYAAALDAGEDAERAFGSVIAAAAEG